MYSGDLTHDWCMVQHILDKHVLPWMKENTLVENLHAHTDGCAAQVLYDPGPFVALLFCLYKC